MTITFEYWKDGRGITLRDEGLRFQFFHSEAIQVRDEFNQRYPLSGAELDALGRPSVVAKKPTPTPAPLSLEVGKWYKRRDGETVQIIAGDSPHEFYRFVASSGATYTINGSYSLIIGSHAEDLLEEVPPPALKLEVGKWYLRRDGGKVQIKSAETPDKFGRRFVDGDGCRYYDSGGFLPEKLEFCRDLIAETIAPGVMEMEGCSIGDVSSTSRPATLSIGDTVRLKSGGPVMTVVYVAKSERIDCLWFNENVAAVSHGDFHRDALVRAKP